MANRIRLLSPHVAERIAAGEVIERPSSVVKELIENSLDAGATEILVNLEDGGKALIEVIDNGHGMTPDDLTLCIERHATSKLSSLDDLEKIHTLGFRGEALPSVAAVADLSILSRAKESDTAYELNASEISGRLEKKPTPQKVTFGHFINTPHGTQIQARGLFSQIPARLKFLKSQGAEVSQVREWMERLAFAYPAVGFKLISDDRTILNLRPQDEKTRVLAILGDGDDYPVISAANEQDGFRDVGFQVRVHWLQGLSCPNSRRLVQVVNSRAVRDKVLQQAMLASFRQALLPGQYPAVALMIEIHPAAIDVNVHPTKSEIRFLDSRKVFHTVETVIKSMIARNGAPGLTPLPWDEKKTPTASPSSESYFSNPIQTFPSWKAAETHSIFEPRETPAAAPFTSPEPKQHVTPSPFPLSPARPNLLESARQAGTLFNTYLLYEKENELILVDQHAAHERIRYEKLKRKLLGSTENPRLLSAQALLIPEPIKILEEDRPRLESRLNWLSRYGFEAEIFGEDTVLFRSVPGEWGNKQLKTRLKNLIDRLLEIETEENSVVLDETLFEALASEACHSAVRAGDRLEAEEIQSIVQELFDCEHPWNCPHGRPTVVKIPEGKFEEWFQRRV